jgi:putative sugar O-methyltransferase
MKLKYLRHPLRTFSNAKSLLTARLSMLSFSYHGRRKFRGDARYNLKNVTDGFDPHLDDQGDDTELLERICTAYIKTVEREGSASDAYKATEWWEHVRRGSLARVRRALLGRDIGALQKMYRNFYRDSCSTGLLGVPYGMSKAYFGGPIKDVHRHFYLSHVLYRLNYWSAQTDNKFTLSDLAGPRLGNPFGIQLGDTLVRVGAEYAHYCAHRISLLLGAKKSTVAEIGGGFGGMAYYLLRDRPGVTYLDFDVPESVALSSYHLMKAFPQLNFLLYGEQRLTKETIDRFDVILMPLFELDALPAESVDVCFSSHAMSDLSSEAMEIYMDNISRVTRDVLLYIGNRRASESISSLVTRKYDSFKLADTRSSGWHSHKVSGAGVGGAAGIAASMMFEQRYTRTAMIQRDPV